MSSIESVLGIVYKNKKLRCLSKIYKKIYLGCWELRGLGLGIEGDSKSTYEQSFSNYNIRRVNNSIVMNKPIYNQNINIKRSTVNVVYF